MKYLTKHKNKLIALAFNILFIVFATTVFTVNGSVPVVNASGCYNTTGSTSCPGTDSNGNNLDTLNNCYQESRDSKTGAVTWTQTDCTNLPKNVHCGGGNGQATVVTSIDLGCTGRGNPIMDMLFAFIRLLSDGVGIVVIGSIIVAGIQYSASQGDPNNTSKAITRIRSSLIALLIFIFAYAILNYVIPGQILH
jgi:hypothetical protein